MAQWMLCFICGSWKSLLVVWELIEAISGFALKRFGHSGALSNAKSKQSSYTTLIFHLKNEMIFHWSRPDRTARSGLILHFWLATAARSWLLNETKRTVRAHRPGRSNQHGLLSFSLETCELISMVMCCRKVHWTKPAFSMYWLLYFAKIDRSRQQSHSLEVGSLFHASDVLAKLKFWFFGFSKN